MSAAIKLSSPATKEFWEIPVLFEDEHLLALDKPSGLLTSPDRFDPKRPNLMRLLHQGIEQGKPWAAARKLAYLANAHRLDSETSGVLLLAKSKPVLVALANSFGARQPAKTYCAIVTGTPYEDKFTVDVPIAPHPLHPGLMRVDPKLGKNATTEFEVAEKFQGYALFKCRPSTDRPHQIRVHLSRAGFPIASDALYGGRSVMLSALKRGDYRLKPGQEERPLLTRVALHAADLTLCHPVTGAEVKIEAPLPREFQVALKYLRRYAA